MTKLTRLLLALLIAGAAGAVSAQERPRRPQAPRPSSGRPSSARASAPQESVLRLLPADSVTEHTVDIPAGKLAYTATAGTLSLFDQSGERSAAVYYTAYVAKNAEAASRPITFAFNGGPGAASAFLTLGLVGPRIARVRGQRSCGNADAGQSGNLARLHRSRHDRSGRHRLEPGGQGRRRQSVLQRAERRRLARQGRRALSVEERPRRLAQVHPGRELRRLPRRQGGARAAARAGHRPCPAS